MAGFFTRPDLEDRQFKQTSGSTLTLSGDTDFVGVLKSKGVEIDASTNPGTIYGDVLTFDGNKIKLMPNLSGGSGSQIYSGASPSNITVGGMPAGTTLTGRTISSILQEILIDTFYPTLTPPSNGISNNQSTQEVGNIVNVQITQTFDRGSINPQYPPTSSPKRSGPPNTYHYGGSGLPANVPSSSLSDTQTSSGYKVLLGSNTWTGTVSYDGGVQPYDSDGNPYDSPLPAGTTSSKSTSFTGYYYRFYGPNATTPTNSAQVRGLPSHAFQTSNVNIFTLNTGNALTKFVVALPPSRTITEVIDIDALNANITSQYVLVGTITVNDGGGSGDPRTYNLYEMNIGTPYSANHRHKITTG